jgi:phosphocarrier protein HPr
LRSTTAIVSDPVGFHLRAAGRIVKLTKKFAAEVVIAYNGRSANAKSIMGLASLAAEFGSRVEIRADGPDEELALSQLARLISVELAHPEPES